MHIHAMIFEFSFLILAHQGYFVNGATAPYRLRGSNAPWVICWFWRNINCLFCVFT